MAKLIQNLLIFMKHAELESYDSIGKKTFVLNSMKELFNTDDEMDELLSEIIDVIIAIDRNKVYIRKKTKLCFFCL